MLLVYTSKRASIVFPKTNYIPHELDNQLLIY